MVAAERTPGTITHSAVAVCPPLCCLLFATTVSHGVNQRPAWVCVLCFGYAHSGLTAVGPPGESDVITHLRELNHPLCVC